jgi:cytochrome c biogenesis protein CcdA
VTLILIGLVGGVITGLSPCVLPVLPVVFFGGGSGSGTEPDTTASARWRPYLIVGGLTLSFAVFTFFGSFILASLHLPDDAIRWLGLALLVAVGLGLLVPSRSPITPRMSTSTSEAPAPSPSPPTARPRSSASRAPPTSTPSRPSSPRRTAPWSSGSHPDWRPTPSPMVSERD